MSRTPPSLESRLQVARDLGLTETALRKWQPMFRGPGELRADGPAAAGAGAQFETGEVRIYGPILDALDEQFMDYLFEDSDLSYLCVSASSFRQAMQAAGDDITIRVNSPGGNAHEGAAMRGTILEALAGGARVSLVVDGLAASAATLPLMAVPAANCRIQQVAEVMVHRASTTVAGNAEDMQAMAAWLVQTDTAAAGLYAERLGISEEAALELMSAETWYGAQAAVDSGMVGGIVSAEADSPAGAGEEDDHKMAGDLSTKTAAEGRLRSRLEAITRI